MTNRTSAAHSSTGPLYQLVYRSRSAASLPPEAMAHILAASRLHNERDGLTGALLHQNARFAQVLEGQRAAIETTFERILCDPRHGDVAVLHFGPLRHRTFPCWWMADAGAALSGEAPPALDPEAADDIVSVLRRLVYEQEAPIPVG